MAIAARTCQVKARSRKDTLLQRLSRLGEAMTPLNGVGVEVRRRLGVLTAGREAPEREKT